MSGCVYEPSVQGPCSKIVCVRIVAGVVRLNLQHVGLSYSCLPHHLMYSILAEVSATPP